MGGDEGAHKGRPYRDGGAMVALTSACSQRKRGMDSRFRGNDGLGKGLFAPE